MYPALEQAYLKAHTQSKIVTFLEYEHSVYEILQPLYFAVAVDFTLCPWERSS